VARGPAALSIGRALATGGRDRCAASKDMSRGIRAVMLCAPNGGCLRCDVFPFCRRRNRFTQSKTTIPTYGMQIPPVRAKIRPTL